MEHNLVLAHKFSIRHRESVLASKRCYCFYCRENFAPDEIMSWVDKRGQTALCPRCGIDAVIGDYDFPHIANADFLNRMHDHWFGTDEEDDDVCGRCGNLEEFCSCPSGPLGEN